VGTDFRIERNFLNCGAGFGGSCFPKDVKALIGKARDINYDPELLRSVVNVNDRQPLKMIELLQEKIGELKKKRVAVLGLAFKNDTDDIRESRSIPVIAELLRLDADVVAYDPMAAESMKKIFGNVVYTDTAAEALVDADGCLIMTEWGEFKELDAEFNAMADRVVIDGRHMIKPKDISINIDYEGLCW
jgi:UDPglucose 6-dehydrogenase